MAANSGHYLSHGRRFVILGNPTEAWPVADGVMFHNGTVIVTSRLHGGVEVWCGGITALPEPVQDAVEWIDALRPNQEVTP